MKSKVNCEHCVYYEFDDEYGCYVCMMDLDEDEFARFMMKSFDNCPYFRLNDEYKTARKQM